MTMKTRTDIPSCWKVRGGEIQVSDGLILGVLNVTPDSFSDGGCFLSLDAALERVSIMVRHGVRMLDVGGESTRPGAMPVSVEVEIRRTQPIITAIKQHFPKLWISIDTSKSEVARAALDAGAHVVNDVSGLLKDPQMEDLCMEYQAGVVVMHMQGTPANMQNQPQYLNVVEEVRMFFEQRQIHLLKKGFEKEQLCFDPGIGFGKSHRHNLLLLRDLDKIWPEGSVTMLGISRKSFIARSLGESEMSLRHWPTVALTTYGFSRHALVHRLHETAGLEGLLLLRGRMTTGE